VALLRSLSSSCLSCTLHVAMPSRDRNSRNWLRPGTPPRRRRTYRLVAVVVITGALYADLPDFDLLTLCCAVRCDRTCAANVCSASHRRSRSHLTRPSPPFNARRLRPPATLPYSVHRAGAARLLGELTLLYSPLIAPTTVYGKPLQAKIAYY
jgi:hypothetical protein